MPPAADDAPLRERILDAAEDVLRRHGAEKANVVDVARALGMSHGNIYRHFASKRALLDAVATRWLDKVTGPLAAITNDRGRAAADRLVAWFDALRQLKRRKVIDDPELFRVHHRQVIAMRDVVDQHVATLRAQLQRIIDDGIASGEFRSDVRARSAARAFLYATSAFHHPAMILHDPQPSEADAKAVVGLLIQGLRGTR